LGNDITLNPGAAGAVVATDDIAGRHYAVGKIAIGIEDAFDGYVAKALPLPVELGLVDPKTSTATAVAISPGSSSDIDSTQVSSGKTGKLVAFSVSSSVSIKAVLYTVLNGATTERMTKVILVGGAGDFKMPHKDFFTVAEDATAGLDGFRLTVHNLDTSEAADAYATFFWDEV